MNKYIVIVLFLQLVFVSLIQADSYYPVWRVGTRQPVVALTFDDGPKPEFSLPVLDALDKYCVKATFFVIGKLAAQHPDIIYRMASSGHDVANHTFSHIRLDTMSKAEVDAELSLTNQIIEKITGAPVRYFRPPGGRFNQLVLMGAQQSGLRTINWSVNAADYTLHGDMPLQLDDNKWKEIADKVVNSCKSGDIVLCHNGGIDTEKALPVIIEKLRHKGFRFVTISELLGVNTPFNKKQYAKINLGDSPPEDQSKYSALN